MPVSTTTASPWPSRVAHCSAGIFIGASGAINITYGWQKGTDLSGSLTWAVVAAVVAIVFALSWPALIRSLEARRWSAALVALVALLLTGSYSMTAALGSAAGGRANAATAETASTGDRTRLQFAYDRARSELEVLQPSRSVGELEAVIAGARPKCQIVVLLGRRETVCAPPSALVAELGRSKRRVELEATMAKASGELAKIGPAKQANSDARTLARYMQAIGVNTTAERLNDLLVLLAVLMIEAGGGLSLALGLALGVPPARPVEALATAPAQLRTPQANAPAPKPHTLAAHPTTCVQPHEHKRSGVVEWLAQHGGKAETSRRRLAAALGRSPSAVHAELARLAASGAITMTCGPQGTALVLQTRTYAETHSNTSLPKYLSRTT